jgi:hypothetical protein
MKTFSQKKLWINSPSFALISVLALVSLAALTATAFLASARLERQATSSIGITTRLEMALNSGKVCLSQVINDNSQSDAGGNTHIVTYWRGGGVNDWTNELGYPFIGQIKTSGTPGQQSAIWYYFPLFSPAGVTNLDTNVISTAMRFTNTHQGTFSNDMQTYMTANATNGFTNNPGLTNPRCVQIPLLGGRTSPPVGWVYINQEKRKLGSALTNTSPAVRIAWFAEDLEGLIDAERMGGLTTRSSGTNSEEISLTSATDTNGSKIIPIISTFTNARKAFISYGLLASSNVSGITNSTNARYFASGLRAWAPTNPASPNNGALAWIPAGIPISGSSTAPKGYTNQGYTKFNLNNLATNSGSTGQALTNIAQIITSNLSTNFLARAGGLTNNNRFDYAKCIAANIVDYIDSNSTPSVLTGNGGYRGCEALPLVSEVALSIQWTNQVKTGVRYEEEFEVVHLVEFWNMFNKPFNGTVNFGYNSTLEAQVGLTPKFALNNVSLITSGNLTNSYNLSLQPNEVRAYASPPIRYKVLSGIVTEPDYGGKKATNGGTIRFGRPGFPTATNFTSTWTLSAGGMIYDQTTSIEEPTFTVACEKYATAAANRVPDFICHQPSLRLDPPNKTGEVRFGTGDLRITFFSTNTSDPNNHGIFNTSNFDESASLGYRNTIWAYTPRKGSTTQPSVWLDGGHANSPRGTKQVPGVDTRVYTLGTVTVNPAFAPALASHVPTTAIQNEAPANIADARMTNIFELGRIFDPMQWQTAISMTPTAPQAVNPTNITTSSTNDYQQGGGNTLRVGRAEHQRFSFTNMYGNSVPSIPNMAQSSAALLDLFCLTNGTSVSGGPYSLGGGKINLNTAPAPVLRALAGGILLTNDPAQVPASYTIPPAMAEAFAQGVMRFRSKYPFLTPSHLSFIGTDPAWPNTNNWPTNSVFGNTNTIALSTAPGNTLSSAKMNITGWNDQAAEEWFSKIYALSSCQSHNYRVYVVAQLVATNSSGQTNAIGPLVKKYYHIYARNGSSASGNNTVSTYPNNSIYTWKPTVGVIDIYKSPY